MLLKPEEKEVNPRKYLIQNISPVKNMN